MYDVLQPCIVDLSVRFAFEWSHGPLPISAQCNTFPPQDIFSLSDNEVDKNLINMLSNAWEDVSASSPSASAIQQMINWQLKL